MSNDPRIVEKGIYQGTRDPGPPPPQLYRPQIVRPAGVSAAPQANSPSPSSGAGNGGSDTPS
jgi:hypothetical protein